MRRYTCSFMVGWFVNDVHPPRRCLDASFKTMPCLFYSTARGLRRKGAASWLCFAALLGYTDLPKHNIRCVVLRKAVKAVLINNSSRHRTCKPRRLKQSCRSKKFAKDTALLSRDDSIPPVETTRPAVTSTGHIRKVEEGAAYPAKPNLTITGTSLDGQPPQATGLVKLAGCWRSGLMVPGHARRRSLPRRLASGQDVNAQCHLPTVHTASAVNEAGTSSRQQQVHPACCRASQRRLSDARCTSHAGR